MIVLLIYCSEALQVATFIRKNAKKQMTRFSGNLEIGPKLKIPIKIFTKVSVHLNFMCISLSRRIASVLFGQYLATEHYQSLL